MLNYKIISVGRKLWLDSETLKPCPPAAPNAKIFVPYNVLISETGVRFMGYVAEGVTGAALYSSLKSQAPVRSVEGSTFS